MRVIVSSILFATFTMLKISAIQGITSRPLGMADITDSSILKNITLETISRHMLPYIRHQPVKMETVLLLPPMEKASGAAMVSVDRTTYCSAIFSRSFSTFHMMMMLQMMTTSHPASRFPRRLASTRCTLTALGSSRSTMILEVISSTSSQSCGLAISRKEKIALLPNSIFGSSASKPRPAAIPFMAWNTRFPSSSAQPTARNTCMMSAIMGTWLLM